MLTTRGGMSIEQILRACPSGQGFCPQMPSVQHKQSARGKHVIAAPQVSLSTSFCQVAPRSAVPRQHPHHPFQPHALGAAVRGAR